jgi:aspartate racemase
MQTVGLLGGMSFESTLPYYRIINETVRQAKGGLHSAQIILYSVDFHVVERMQASGAWAAAGEYLAGAARAVEAAGADFLVLCTNTMHIVAPAIELATSLPLLHIADPTAAAVAAAGVSTVGLVGTRFTMEGDFYRDRLRMHGIESLIPPAPRRERVDRIIYDELCQGVVLDDSRVFYREVIASLVARGAQGIVLGCTEIAMLVGEADVDAPVFDTARIHAEAAARRAMRGSSDRTGVKASRAKLPEHR